MILPLAKQPLQVWVNRYSSSSSQDIQFLSEVHNRALQLLNNTDCKTFQPRRSSPVTQPFVAEKDCYGQRSVVQQLNRSARCFTQELYSYKSHGTVNGGKTHATPANLKCSRPVFRDGQLLCELIKTQSHSNEFP